MERKYLLTLAAVVLLAPVGARGAEPAGTPDPAQTPTLYTVGYSHLGTQWRWAYPRVIREYIPKTMRENFVLFEKYPNYIFNFSGANRYRMMKEYYPAEYEKVRQYVAAGRWFPCGSSMEECDVNVPSAESIIRQVLYGNQFFRRELGKASAEFMLPDCFGFPASLPSLLAHCGLRGFSTQKLSWGSAMGIPFNVGVWEGLNGAELFAALNAGDYTAKIGEDLSQSDKWLARVRENGERHGLYADFRYYGVGDEGGAPTDESVRWIEQSLKGEGPLRVLSVNADQMFLEVATRPHANLPRYRGDLLLTEHSAGSITSAAYMKRWNRKNELLADAAERASVLAEWLGGPEYPRQRLNDAWTLVLGGQFHDILPGTSIPKAYEYSWNDELLALNQFAGVLESALAAIAAGLDTEARGVPIVVYNPLAVSRQDVVEAAVRFPGAVPPAVRVVGPDGKDVPSQVLRGQDETLHILFLADVPSVSFTVYDVRPAEAAAPAATGLKITESALENERYRVMLDAQGDVAGILDKAAGREVLSAPLRLAFQQEKPRHWPAWNMDWSDRQQPPRAYLGGPAKVHVVESGPVRVTLEIEREAEGSRFLQRLRLAAGDAGNRIEFADTIWWRSRECSLKATFPLSVGNPQATYNWEVGTLERGNNDPKKYEVPSHQWFDLTEAKGDYGVTVLSDCKYGSDKPDDHTLRLTLLYTPGVHSEYQDQAVQDWGQHEILYGLAAHRGDWRTGRTDGHALRLSQPLLAFQTPAHPGPLGKTLSLLSVSNPRVGVLALKKAEESDELIVRLVELDGREAGGVQVTFAAPVTAAREVNGQEQPVGAANVVDAQLAADFTGYQLRTFAVRLAAAPAQVGRARSRPLELPYDRCVTTRDGQSRAAGFDGQHRCLPAEMLPREVMYGDVPFHLGPVDHEAPNAVVCNGQVLPLPDAPWHRVYLLAASAADDHKVSFHVGDQRIERTVQNWRGYIGQWDNRVWKGDIPEVAFAWPYEFVGLQPAYVRNDPVAWFCSHHHTAEGRNALYEYCYLYAYTFDVPAGARTFTLPTDESVLVLAATATAEPAPGTRPAQPLYDELQRAHGFAAGIQPPGGRFSDVVAVTIAPPLYGAERTVHYTLDGSTPTPRSPQYAASLLLAEDTVVRVGTFAADGAAGPLSEARFQINDTTSPRAVAAAGISACPELVVRFSEPVEAASAERAANYTVSGGARVKAAKLAPDGQGVTLALDPAPQSEESPSVTVRGVRDRARAGNARTEPDTVPVAWARPVLAVAAATSDGRGAGGAEQPLPADAPLAPATTWTINFWVWMDRQPEDLSVLAGFGSCEDQRGTQRYLCKFKQGIHFWGSGVDVPTGVAFDVGQWQMITAGFDGQSVRVFKNGELLRAEAITLAPAAGVVKLGPPPPWGNGHHFAGRVERFTLWNQALTAESIAALFRLGREAAAPGGKG